VALVAAALAMLMMLAIGAGIVLNTMTETTVAANHRDAVQALYAAEAGIELTISRLRGTADWSTVAGDIQGTTFVQGSLAVLLQSATVDPRLNVAASVYPDPHGDQDVLIVRSSASAAGIRRTIEVTIRRAPATDSATARKIETLSWRER
jgi:type IV pilus assembly PilX-like protein